MSRHQFARWSFLLVVCGFGTAPVMSSSSGPAAPILFVIQAQDGTFHTEMAGTTKASILKQWKAAVPSNVLLPPDVLLTTEIQEGKLQQGAWTYFPLFPFLAEYLENNQLVDWVAILNENTQLNLRALIAYAQQRKEELKPREERYFMGRALKDESPTIIHHFHMNTEENTVTYPDHQLGIFLSRKLVLDLKDKTKAAAANLDFHIDPEFELAKFLLTDSELGVGLTDVTQLCPKEPKRDQLVAPCVTHPRLDYKCLKNKEAEKQEEILQSVFAIVSTCSKYHKTRVPAIKQTWEDLIPNLNYISDTVDEEIPTLVLPYTINTETGYCNKTRTMLDRFLESNLPWLLIVDDDTVFSPARLSQMLACYSQEEPIILGQRYGYKTAAGYGYNYLTGGGGKLANRPAVAKLVGLADNGCACPAPDTPEDMHIFGVCAKKADIPITHSPRMFQARPPDYPSAQISYRKPVSFHKHWEIDPVKVYDEWFRRADAPLRELRKAKTTLKDEL